MEIKTITMVVQNGQIQFENVPEGYGIHVKNYDTDVAEDAFLTQEEMEESQLFKDEVGWFYSFYFANLGEQVGEEQLTLPIEGLQ